MPVALWREGVGVSASFWYDPRSWAVELDAGVLCAACVLAAAPILPYAPAFAAGAMVYVVVEEVVPEAQNSGNADLAAIALGAGFSEAMALDVGLGGACTTSLRWSGRVWAAQRPSPSRFVK